VCHCSCANKITNRNKVHDEIIKIINSRSYYSVPKLLFESTKVQGLIKQYFCQWLHMSVKLGLILEEKNIN
jgi:hypothetical protein